MGEHEIGVAMANVRVFGFLEEGKQKWGGNIIDCRDISPDMDLRGCDLAILPFGNLFHDTFMFHDEDAELRAVEQLQSRIRLALEQGTHVCLVYSHVHMPTDFRELVDYLNRTGRALGERILRREEIDIEKIARTNDLKSFSKHLELFVREYAATEYCFRYKMATKQFQHVLCHPQQNAKQVTGFALKIDKGFLYILPGEPVEGTEEDFMRTLVDCLLADIQARLHPKTAPIAQSFQFANEKKVRDERQAVEFKLQEIEATIAEYQERKEILFLRDDPLADRLPEWLTIHFGIKTRRHEEYIEDSWIVDENGSDVAICETKGLSKNVKREHITALVQHREQRDLPDDFPSILFVNTFADAETVEEKDKQRITKIECKKAVSNHVLIVRTLDLVRLLDLAEQGKMESPKIRELLLSETGWLKVTDEGYEVVKE